VNTAQKINDMASSDTIQTLHPVPGKTNKKISMKKYEFIRDNLLAILKKAEPTHLELMETLHQRIHATFDGSPHWYGETVKLDLEARGVIERVGKKPERYKLREN
jgi:hypothetical protein